jgi:hypothetical protein
LLDLRLTNKNLREQYIGYCAAWRRIRRGRRMLEEDKEDTLPSAFTQRAQCIFEYNENELVSMKAIITKLNSNNKIVNII